MTRWYWPPEIQLWRKLLSLLLAPFVCAAILLLGLAVLHCRAWWWLAYLADGRKQVSFRDWAYDTFYR